MILQAFDVTKKYPGVQDVVALDNVSFGVEKGEWLSIEGASGSGKSTLLHILGCLDKPTAGNIEIAGKDPSKLDDESLSIFRGKHIGFVFQQFHLLNSRSALENVMLAGIYQGITKDERRKRSLEVLDSVGMGHRVEHLPDQLSGGEKQRIAIARALASKPSILLCDEPTGNLDSHNTDSILALLQNLHDVGTTIILITHDANVGKRAGRVIKIKDGKVQ